MQLNFGDEAWLRKSSARDSLNSILGNFVSEDLREFYKQLDELHRPAGENTYLTAGAMTFFDGGPMTAESGGTHAALAHRHKRERQIFRFEF